MGLRFDIIDIDSKNKGIIQVGKDRRAGVLIMVEKNAEASEVDTMILMQEIKDSYIEYLRRIQKNILE